MIKVNLVGTGRQKTVKPAMKISMPSNFTPVLLLVVIVGFAAGGYLWYATLTAHSADLDQQIRGLEARKAALDAVIKQDQIYATVKKKLESRVRIVESLSKNQLSPILAELFVIFRKLAYSYSHKGTLVKN